MLIAEIKDVETMFDIGISKNRPPMPVSHPQYGGLAIWAQSLICRIDKAHLAIENLYFVPSSPLADDSLDKFKKLRSQLDNYIAQSSFKEWTATLGDMYDQGAVDQQLSVPVLRRLELPEKTDEKPPEKKGAKVQPKESRAPEVRLRSNFNVDLLKVINEVAIWNKIQSLGMINMNVSIVRLLTESETLRKLRENVMMIVRDYNSI
jgi:dynein heavy chain